MYRCESISILRFNPCKHVERNEADTNIQAHLGPLWLLMQLQNLILKGLHAPKSAPHKNPDSISLLQCFRGIPQLGILHGQPSRGNGKVRKTIVALGILGIIEMFFRLEDGVRHLGSDLTGVMRDIESCDSADGGFAIDDVLKEGFLADAAAGDDA